VSKYLGAHTIDNGGIHMAVRRAANASMKALQVFSAKPQFYNDKISVRPERVVRFKEAMATSGIAPRNVVVHGAYVLNVATSDEEKWTRAAAGLAKELERSATLGVGCVCFHPGSAGSGNDVAAAAKRVARAIIFALENIDTDTRLLVENTAGAGATIARHSEEMHAILSAIPKSLRPRTGYGLDTCHLFSSGYDIHTSRERLTAVLDEFEKATGEPPAFFHLNDSEGDLGSNKDRHLLIGEGKIGLEPFRWLMKDSRTSDIPLILETPQLNYDIGDEDDTPDPYDLQMMALLLS
jgi:deoxyribonuclease IV